MRECCEVHSLASAGCAQSSSCVFGGYYTCLFPEVFFSLLLSPANRSKGFVWGKWWMSKSSSLLALLFSMFQLHTAEQILRGAEDLQLNADCQFQMFFIWSKALLAMTICILTSAPFHSHSRPKPLIFGCINSLQADAKRSAATVQLVVWTLETNQSWPFQVCICEFIKELKGLHSDNKL